MMAPLKDLLDRIRSAFARIINSVRTHRGTDSGGEERSFAGVCPFCGLLTPRKSSRCLECGKSLKLA
jgi:hypothetical protein